MLWLGIGATIGANIAYGAGYGLLGALISAWPAVAFIGSVEIAMQQVRRARVPRAATGGPAVPEVPGDVEQAVRAAYAASVAAGQPLSQRAMAERFGLSRRKVSQLVTSVSAESNGHLLAGTGGMSVNRYGVIAQRHWARWLPKQYAAISDPESFFTTLGEEVARQIDDLTDELVGEIGQSDSYLAHVGGCSLPVPSPRNSSCPSESCQIPNWQQTTIRTTCRQSAGNGRWSWTATTRHGRR